MGKRRILVQWIGHSDLRAMAATLPAAKRTEILNKLKGPQPQEGDRGPTKTLLETQDFDEVRLLSNYAADWNKQFLSWLGGKAHLVKVTLKKPTDYAAIFKIADDELAAIRKRKDGPNSELCLHLSPGTPAMAAVWLLLGKTRYPATFYETYGGESWITDVRFDLTVDVIPEIFRDPDVYLQHLASESPAQVEGFTEIAGDSRAIRDAVGRAKRAAMRGVSILLLGETGTRKDMFAKAIHLASPRRERPFRAINCAALSKSLLESELFGHVKGAFTGADHPRVGAFEEAHGGTLFLDEVGECDFETQAKLLRVLQPVTDEGASIRMIRRLGDDKDRKVDVRVIAATNNDLHKSIRDGSFREDLYYRLASLAITLPPLRERKSDIPKIAGKLLAQINKQFAAEEPNYKHKSLSASANEFVKKHTWPGNVRQLYNALVQAAVLTDGENIGHQELAASIGELCESSGSLAGVMDRPLGDGLDLEEHLNDIRRNYLRRAMEEARGIKVKAARLLGMKNYQTFDAQLKRLEVDGEWSPRD
ncbi:MAG: sigma 54-interacting transcriptional regulator [Planctomycetaceae bacterium]|nr:sigma 54-interacting transcriptional regulator [Planctomycetaceae bacterium]